MKLDQKKQFRNIFVLPDAWYERAIQAARIIFKWTDCKYFSYRNEEAIRAKALQGIGVGLEKIHIVDPEKIREVKRLSLIYFSISASKGYVWTSTADMKLTALFWRDDGSRRNGRRKCCWIAIDHRRCHSSGIQIVGMPAGISVVSSFFLMVFPHISYSICWLRSGAGSTQNKLADIAISTARITVSSLAKNRVLRCFRFHKRKRFTSFCWKSTEGNIYVKMKQPNLIVDGELQFDAAMCPFC